MIILGVDPALTITGYGVINAGKGKVALIEAGIITTSTKEQIPKRLKKINKAINKLIKDVQPDYLVLEKIYSHYRHPTTAYILGQARGVICLAAGERGIPLVEYAATRIKKAIVGRGLASKNQVQRMVANILNLDSIPKCPDVTDALALAIAHNSILKGKL